MLLGQARAFDQRKRKVGVGIHCFGCQDFLVTPPVKRVRPAVIRKRFPFVA
jgi:hypothetical protein